MTHTLNGAPLLVVGAGTMGVGIAQVAAQAGHAVMLFDSREGAAVEAKQKLAKTLDGLAAKGKLSAEAVAQTLSRIEAIGSLDAAASVRLVVEAIVEKLDIKRSLFKQLEAIVANDCVLAHQHLVDLGHCDRQRPAASGPVAGHAFLQPGAFDEAGRSRVGIADQFGGGGRDFRVEQDVGQGASACAFDPGIYREPDCPSLLR